MITADGGGYHERHYNKPENAVPLTYKEKKSVFEKSEFRIEKNEIVWHDRKLTSSFNYKLNIKQR